MQGIKCIQERGNFGSWCSQLYEFVKQRDSCWSELAIEPLFWALPFSELVTKSMEDNESEILVENPPKSESLDSSTKEKQLLYQTEKL